MNVEIGTEAAQFPEKEYINGIFVAVYQTNSVWGLRIHADVYKCTSIVQTEYEPLRIYVHCKKQYLAQRFSNLHFRRRKTSHYFISLKRNITKGELFFHTMKM
jgi:hypothetical protein